MVTKTRAVFARAFLERVLHCKLQDSRIAGTLDHTEGRILQVIIRSAEIRVVEKVEEFESQLHFLAFVPRDIEIARRRSIDIEESGPHLRSLPRIAKLADGIT